MGDTSEIDNQGYKYIRDKAAKTVIDDIQM